jgi:N-acetylmuramoyl-L-alanine amidase
MPIQTPFKYRNKLIPLNLDKVFFIILHHTAIKEASPEEIHRWHLDNGWSGFAYNEYIRKDGSVYIGRGDFIGAHTANMNSKSYGICCEGNYDVEEQMPKPQFDALVKRLKFHKERFKHPVKIESHSTFFPTSCFGKHFPIDELMTELEDDLENAVDVLRQKGIISSPDYWLQNARKGRTVNGEYAGVLIKRVAELLKRGTNG